VFLKRKLIPALTLALLSSAASSAELIHLTLPPAAGETVPVVSVTDARPEWQKKKEILSLNRTACDFAITRWGDKNSTPGRAQSVAQGLGKHLNNSFRDKQFKLTWFTLHSNNRAPDKKGYDSSEPGVVYGVLHSLECRRGAEMVGGWSPEETTDTLPFIVDIVVEVDGRTFSGRALKRITDVTTSSAQVVDEAIARLAKSIQDDAPTATPCDRLKAARDASPKVTFYAKSYLHYCSPVKTK